MNQEAVIELFAEYDYVNYYTVRLISDGITHELSETEKFFEMYDHEDHPNFREFDLLYRVIDAIGYLVKGAEECLFRFEDAAHALPPNIGQARRKLGIEIITDSALRLYCIRLTERVVILINGGVKTTDKALKCPNVRNHFRLAQSVAKAIDGLLVDGIKIVGKEIINETGENEILFNLK